MKKKSKMEEIKSKVAEVEAPAETKAEGGVEEPGDMPEMCKKCALMKEHMAMVKGHMGK